MDDTEEEFTQHREYLTGHKDTDLLVLSRLNDENLLNTCLANKAINKVCQNESFWKSRFISVFDNKYNVEPGYDYPSKYKKDSETWRNFYLKFVSYTSKYRLINNLLIFASFKGDISLVVYAMNSPRISSDTQEMSMMNAAQGGYDEIIKYLINHGVKPQKFFLKWLCGYGSLDIVKFVFSKMNIDVNMSNNVLIRMAANSKKFDTVMFLIDIGANIHSKNDELLDHAAISGRLDIIKYLLDKGANIDRIDNRSPLISSIEREKTSVAKYLIQRGANVNIENSLPLTEAVKTDNLEIVKELVEHGAIVNEDILQLSKDLKNYEIYQYLKAFIKK